MSLQKSVSVSFHTIILHATPPQIPLFNCRYTYSFIFLVLSPIGMLRLRINYEMINFVYKLSKSLPGRSITQRKVHLATGLEPVTADYR
jgi:hypothetical protein